MPRQRRSFPPDFKAEVVLELLTSGASQAELCRKHNVKPQLLAYLENNRPGTLAHPLSAPCPARP